MPNKRKEEEIKGPNWDALLYPGPILKKSYETEAIAYGVERRLYELNPTLACLSPNLIHASVVTPEEALLALEDIAAQVDRPSFPIDRHLTAFFISRWKGLSFMDLRGLGNPQREIKNLAALKILASIQEYFQMRGLPNLCRWMAEICTPMIAHHPHLKACPHIQKRIAKAMVSGRLMQLVLAFENQQPLSISSESQEIKLKAVENYAFIRKASVLRWLAHFWRWGWLAAMAKKT